MRGKGGVVGQDDSCEDAFLGVQSAVKFHLETFGSGVLEGEEGPALEAFVAEATAGPMWGVRS
jgi:hypothetical protein